MSHQALRTDNNDYRLSRDGVLRFMVLSSEAKVYVGQLVEIEFRDREKKLHRKEAEVYDVGFLPAFGPCLITDIGEIRLDRICTCQALNSEQVQAA